MSVAVDSKPATITTFEQFTEKYQLKGRVLGSASSAQPYQIALSVVRDRLVTSSSHPHAYVKEPARHDCLVKLQHQGELDLRSALQILQEKCRELRDAPTLAAWCIDHEFDSFDAAKGAFLNQTKLVNELRETFYTDCFAEFLNADLGG
jgi:hypothetical protein